MNKIYFPGLNGVRFIAAMMVIIAHVEGFKNKMGLYNISDNNIINQLGSQGVKVFFVLSGFLITYLLLVEKERFKSIDVRKFYIRRVLRIWPLYFLVLIIGFFIIPQFYLPEGFTSVQPYFLLKLALAVFLLPNLLFVGFGHIFSIGPLWSIGAEEQFYLIWPNVVKRSESLLKTLILMLVALIIIKSYCEFVVMQDLFAEKINKAFWVINKLLQFDCMVIGGIFAYLFFNKNKVLALLFDKRVSILSLILIAILFVFKPNLYSINNLVFSILYGILILNISSNPNSLVKLENNLFNFLGKVSYGMYMFHSISIAVFIYLLGSKLDNMWVNVLMYIGVTVLTILISFLSYQYFEKPILKYKEKFMKVKSSHSK